MHGPSVYPQLPAGVIELAFVDVINRGPWKVSQGGDRYRRGIYTFFQRTSPYPMLSLFDAPDSNVSCTRRERSNTPLQALSLWNDPVFVECAASLAGRVLRLEARNETSRIEQIFEICLARKPATQELVVIRQLLSDARKRFAGEEDLLKHLGKIGPAVPGVSAVEYGAWFLVARAMINLDEFINRN